MNIEFIEKEQDWANETTKYWFEVDGAEWAIADQADNDLKLLDSEGYPVEDCNDRDRLKDKLIFEIEKYKEE